ncbi:hypothetical protein BGX27_004856, partial [Mortierella sp. AM989]
VDASIAEKQQIVQELTDAVNLLQSGINEMTSLLNSHPSQADDTIPAADLTKPSSDLFDDDKGIKIPSHYPRFRKGDSAHKFIESFENCVIPTLSRTERQTKIHLFLVCLVIDHHFQTSLRHQLNDLIKQEKQANPQCKEIDFSKIISVFYKVCRSPKEKKEFFDSLHRFQLKKGETYRQLALRLLSAKRTVDGQDCDSILLSRLVTILPDSATNIINKEYFGVGSNQSAVDWNSLDKVCKILQGLDGPDEDSFQNILKRQKPDSSYRSNDNQSQKGNQYSRSRKRNQQRRANSKHSSSNNRRNQSQNRRLDSDDDDSSGNNLSESSTDSSHDEYYCKKCGRNKTHSTKNHKECSYCHAHGHIADDCFKRKANQNNKNNKRSRDHRDKDNRDKYHSSKDDHSKKTSQKSPAKSRDNK